MKKKERGQKFLGRVSKGSRTLVAQLTHTIGQQRKASLRLQSAESTRALSSSLKVVSSKYSRVEPRITARREPAMTKAQLVHEASQRSQPARITDQVAQFCLPALRPRFSLYPPQDKERERERERKRREDHHDITLKELRLCFLQILFFNIFY